MAKVFISYRSTERPLVDKLAHDINTLGYNAWFDEQLTGGHEWWEQVLHEIRRADVIVLALSPDSMNSEACKLERQYALDLGKNIIPVQIVPGVNFETLPTRLKVLQVVNYINPDTSSALQLSRSFMELPPAKPLPEPLPLPPAVPMSEASKIRDSLDKPQLTIDEQEAILSRLHRLYNNADERDAAIDLLRRLRHHRDVRGYIVDDIDTLIGKSGAVYRPRQDTPVPTPQPQPQPVIRSQQPASPPRPQPVAQKPKNKGGNSYLVAGIVVAVLLVIATIIAIVAFNFISQDGSTGSESNTTFATRRPGISVTSKWTTTPSATPSPTWTTTPSATPSPTWTTTPSATPSPTR